MLPRHINPAYISSCSCLDIIRREHAFSTICSPSPPPVLFAFRPLRDGDDVALPEAEIILLLGFKREQSDRLIGTD